MSLITTSELFGEVPKIYVSQTSQFSGDLVWLSEEKINFEYNNDIYFFADTDGNQKTEYSLLMLQSQKLSLLQTYIRSKKTLLQKSTQLGLSPQSLVKIKR